MLWLMAFDEGMSSSVFIILERALL